MGQIVSSAAKPKRCNLSKLSQLGTPAAGEHILVSSDNSMNAAGQGNFDCYIVGNGRDAATALKLKSLVDDGVFDISTYRATGDVLAKYADIAAALDGGNNIPQSIRKGGMSVKFVQSSDNKYVQYRLVATEFSTTVSDWQGVDDEPTAGSKNLVKSGGVYTDIGQLENKIGSEDEIKTYSTQDDYSGMFWGGEKLYAANTNYNSYVFIVKKGINYSWNGGFTFQKFDSLPTIGSSEGHIGTLQVVANTPWEADGDYWLMINVNLSNPFTVTFTTYAHGIRKDIGTLSNLDTTDKSSLVNAINEVNGKVATIVEDVEEEIFDTIDKVGVSGFVELYADSSKFSGMFWGGDKVYAANASYNSYVFIVKKGINYSWNGGFTFQKFNASPTIGSAAGRIGTLQVSRNTQWEADGDYWLMFSFNPANPTAITFTRYGKGIANDIDNIHENLDALNNKLGGIKIVCFGDSLTEFAGVDGKRYSDWIAELTGATIVNCGIGGTQLRQRATPVETPTTSAEAYAALDIINLVKAVCEEDFTKQINAANYLETHASDDNTEIVQRLSEVDFSTIDLVTIFAGTNDFALGGHLGTTGSTDINTTLGAINEIVRLLLSTYPKLHIVWFSPVVRWADAIANRNDGNWVDSWQGYRAEGKTLLDYNNAIISEVERNFIPIADMLHTMGWTKYNFSEYFLDTDGVHPRKGFHEIAQKFISFIIATRAF